MEQMSGLVFNLNKEVVVPLFPNYIEDGERLCPKCGRVTQATDHLEYADGEIDVTASQRTVLPPRFCGNCGARFEKQYDYYDDFTEDYDYYETVGKGLR